MSNLKQSTQEKKLTLLQQIFGNIGVGSMGRGTIIGRKQTTNI